MERLSDRRVEILLTFVKKPSGGIRKARAGESPQTMNQEKNGEGEKG